MAADLESLLEHLGITLGRSTDYEVYGLCPGHKRILGREDRRPTTWSVARTTGAHHCFSCGYGGTLAELILDQGEATSYWAALGIMGEYGLDPADPDDLPKTYYERRKIVPPTFLDEEELSGFTKPPRKALDSRMMSVEAADYYGVRWDPERRSWIFPVRLMGGALLGWQEKGKNFFNNHPPKVQKSKTLFGIDVFEYGQTAILMESPPDVPRIFTAGYLGGVSAYGAAVSDDQMRLLLSMTDTLIVALDNDDTGAYWTQRLVTGKWVDHKGQKHTGTAWATKFDTYILNYLATTAKDPGEMEDDEFDWAIDNAVHSTEWGYD